MVEKLTVPKRNATSNIGQSFTVIFHVFQCAANRALSVRPDAVFVRTCEMETRQKTRQKTRLLLAF